MSFNPNAGGSVADGSVTSTKLGGDITTAGKNVLTAADKAAQKTWLATAVADVSGLQTALDGKQASGSYAASTHTHAASDIASGTIATARLGSGSATSSTYLRGDNTWATPSGSGGATVAKAFLASTQANSTVTPAVLTGATFTLTPGQTGVFTAVLVCTGGATTTGIGAGFRVAQASGADGNARGAWFGYVNLASTATATGLADGDVYNVAANANAYGEVLGTATTAGNNVWQATAVVTNAATNGNTTVTFEFRSEVASSAVTAQIGSGVTAIIG
jgi:hypothetical protein